MNYTRRSTRPDSLFYRDQRRLSLSSRARARSRAYMLLGAIVAIALVAYMLFRGN